MRLGFTLLEMLVVTIIIAALSAIMIPSLGKARQNAKRVACGETLHGLTIGIRTYLSDFNEIYPFSAQMPSVNVQNEPLPVTLKNYVTTPRAFFCPADTQGYTRTSDGKGFSSYFAGETLSYEYNMGLGGRRIQNAFLYNILHDTATYILVDFDNFHDTKAPACKNILYADSHVGTIDDMLKALGSTSTTLPVARKADMEIRTKNKIGAWGFALLLLGGVGYLMVTHWPASWTFSKPKGTPVSKALQADLKGYDDEKLVTFIKDLEFSSSTYDQRLKLAFKLKTYFDTMPTVERLALMLRMRKIFEEDPNSELVNNARAIMQDFMNQQVKDYINATPEARTKMLDDRIDEQVTMENMINLQNKAKSLFGMKADKNTSTEELLVRDITKFRGLITKIINDSVVNTPPAQRAAMSQFFLDMRNRRLQRGLPVAF